MDKILNIALVQSPLFWEDPELNRRHFTKIVQEVSEDTDVIVLPEMFTTGFTMTPQNVDSSQGPLTLDWMVQTAKASDKALMGSVSYFEQDTYTNRLFFVTPDGTVKYYDKRHTFTLAGEDKVYRAGRKKLHVQYKGFKICPMICYDLRFPVWSRNTEDYDVLIYVANWPKPRITAWDTLLKARAIENMAYSIGVNRIGNDKMGHEYSGHSAAYDCLGAPLVFSEKETVLYATLEKGHVENTRKKLQFLADRDRFNFVD